MGDLHVKNGWAAARAMVKGRACMVVRLSGGKRGGSTDRDTLAVPRLIAPPDPLT